MSKSTLESVECSDSEEEPEMDPPKITKSSTIRVTKESQLNDDNIWYEQSKN